MKRITNIEDIPELKSPFLPLRQTDFDIKTAQTLIKYDFPEFHNGIAYTCKIREDGLIEFYNGSEFVSAYNIFDEDSNHTEDFDNLIPDFSYIKSLTSCRNNPLHYHIISLEKSGNILQFKKKYKFVDNDKYYFEADFDGTSDDNGSANMFSSNDIANDGTNPTYSNFYYDESKDETNHTSFIFKDPTTIVRLKCSSNITSYKINNTKGPTDMITFSPDYLNGFTISDITVEKNSPTTAVLEVWT